MKNFKEMLISNKHSLVISLPSNDANLARAAWQEGVDAVKVHINVEHRASGTAFGSYAEEKDVLTQIIAEAKGPCGIVPGAGLDTVSADYKNVIDAGFNFVSLYAHDMPIALANKDAILKMVAFDSSYDIAWLKHLEKVNADIFEASVMKPESYGDRLSVKELLTYADICENTSLPVLVPTQRNILSCEIAALAACGVKATMIGAIVTGRDEGSIRRAVAEFRNAIDKL